MKFQPPGSVPSARLGLAGESSEGFELNSNQNEQGLAVFPLSWGVSVGLWHFSRHCDGTPQGLAALLEILPGFWDAVGVVPLFLRLCLALKSSSHPPPLPSLCRRRAAQLQCKMTSTKPIYCWISPRDLGGQDAASRASPEAEHPLQNAGAQPRGENEKAELPCKSLFNAINWSGSGLEGLAGFAAQ